MAETTKKTKTVKKTSVEKDKTEEIKGTATKPKLTDDVLVNVKSATFGQLIYINHKTGEKTIWDEYGDVQVMTMRDLRDMKAGNVAFFENNWIYIVGVLSEGYENISVEDIYTALFVQKYYNDIIDLSDFTGVCNWTTDEIVQKIPLLSQSAKTNLVVALNEYINNGVLDSIKKIKTFESVLHCILERPE